MGRGGASGALEPVPASVSTQQWLPGDLQVIKGQKGKGLRKRMERSKIRACGQRQWWGKGAGRPIGPFPPHQVSLKDIREQIFLLTPKTVVPQGF